MDCGLLLLMLTLCGVLLSHVPLREQFFLVFDVVTMQYGSQLRTEDKQRKCTSEPCVGLPPP